MPTIFSHPAVPLALGFALGREIISRRLLWVGVAASILPDLDVVAFGFGIPYEHEFGHRGFSHSFFFAALVALLGAYARRRLNSSFGIAFGFLFLATASHGVLDAFTNGGLGIAFFWPWSGGPSYFFSRWGIKVILSELRWVWLPCALMGLGLAVIKKTTLDTYLRGIIR
jgi:inner membrane protein